MKSTTAESLKIIILSAIFPIMLCILLFWPLLSLGLKSLSGETGEFTLSLYIDVLTNQQYFKSFINTFMLAVLSTIFALVICIPAGIYIEGDHGKDRKLLAVALTIPLSLPGIVIGFFVIITFGFTGIVPKFIEVLTGTRALNFAYTFYGMLLGYVYFQIPRVILTIRGAVSNISQDVIDAARTLGSYAFQIYFHVILPSLRPSIVSASSLSLATGFGAFGTAATLSRGYRVLPLEIATAFTENFQPRLAVAMSVILVMLTTFMLFGVNRFNENTGYGKPEKG
ncbi:MAG TPA: ABC transporter permease [Actinobacteria bacterium]|nr:ABC transporter permease [Actinomycetota bacterium]